MACVVHHSFCGPKLECICQANHCISLTIPSLCALRNSDVFSTVRTVRTVHKGSSRTCALEAAGIIFFSPQKGQRDCPSTSELTFSSLRKKRSDFSGVSVHRSKDHSEGREEGTERNCRTFFIEAHARAAKRGKKEAGEKGGKEASKIGGGTDSVVRNVPVLVAKTQDNNQKNIILSVKRLCKVDTRGEEIIKDLNFEIFFGTKICIFGANEAGRSSLISILAGVDKAFDGDFYVNPDIKVGYLPKEPKLDNGTTVEDIIELAILETRQLLADYRQVSSDMSKIGADVEKLSAQYATLQTLIDACKGWELDHQVQTVLDGLNCPPLDSRVKDLTQRERQKVALCQLLLSRPDALFLEEPTNHLNEGEVFWLEKYFSEFKGTIIASTNSRNFLEKVAGWILELDYNGGFIFEGTYSAFLETKEMRLGMDEKKQIVLQKSVVLDPHQEENFESTESKGLRRQELNQPEVILDKNEKEPESPLQPVVPSLEKSGMDKVIAALKSGTIKSQIHIMDKEKSCNNNKIGEISPLPVIEVFINSPVASMERLAIVENGQLVELVVDPVDLKTRKQVGEVYLGVIQGLAPKMPGAFVDVGNPPHNGLYQGSFMEVKLKKRVFPITFPRIHHASPVMPFRSQISQIPHTNGSVFEAKSVSLREVEVEEEEEEGEEEEEDEDLDGEDEVEDEEDDLENLKNGVEVEGEENSNNSVRNVQNSYLAIEEEQLEIDDVEENKEIEGDLEDVLEAALEELEQILGWKINPSETLDSQWDQTQTLFSSKSPKDTRQISQGEEKINNDSLSITNTKNFKTDEITTEGEIEGDLEDVLEAALEELEQVLMWQGSPTESQPRWGKAFFLPISPVTDEIGKLTKEQLSSNIGATWPQHKARPAFFFGLQNWADLEGSARPRKYWGQLRPGMAIIVQVLKEKLRQKEARLTPIIQLPGRLMTLFPSSCRIALSPQIQDVGEIERLQKIVKEILPARMGCTLHSLAENCSKEELAQDLQRLVEIWENITENAVSAVEKASEGDLNAMPQLLLPAVGRIMTTVREFFNNKVSRMVVDSESTYNEIIAYLSVVAPDLCDRVELYVGNEPVFDAYNIEPQIQQLISKRVDLASGGNLVVEETEAMWVIDVNGGKRVVGGEGEDVQMQDAILAVNLEAARQAAKEIRLRDIGGIIAFDLITMSDESHRKRVLEEMREAVSRDRVLVQALDINEFGVMMLTRKRVRQSLMQTFTEPCSHCNMTGRVEGMEAIMMRLEVALHRVKAANIDLAVSEKDKGNSEKWPFLLLRVDQETFYFLQGSGADRLEILSQTLHLRFSLNVQHAFKRGQFLISRRQPKYLVKPFPVLESSLQS